METNRENLEAAQNSIKNRSCLVCCKQLGSSYTWIKCFRCNILLHHHCEEMYSNRRTFCKCPHCERIGTLFNISNTLCE